MSLETFSKILSERKLISIIRSDVSILEELKRTLPVIYKAGVRLAEITLTTPDALKSIEVGANSGNADLMFGAGTVTTVKEAKDSISAGAQFLVSPILSIPVIEEGLKAGVSVLPGCFTPTEIFNAHEAGAEFVKLFPVSSVGPEYIKLVLAPLANAKIIAVGGVTLSNLHEFLQAGAVGVGVGKSLISEKLIKSGTEGEINACVSQFVRATAGC